MTRYNFIAIIFILFTPLIRVNAQETTGINRIPAEQKEYELSVLWKEISYNYGNIDNCPGMNIDSLYMAFVPKVRATKDDFEYWKTLQRFMACLNNGHTKVFSVPSYMLEHLAYPLLVTSCHNGVVVVDNFGSRMADILHVGDTILTINGLDVIDYFKNEHVPYVTTSNANYKMQDAMFFFNNFNCCLNYNDTIYRLGIKTPNGIKVVDVCADFYLDPKKAAMNDMFFTGGNFWRTQNTFILDTANSCAYIALATCNQSFSDCFNEHFSEIMETDNLVIDISFNSGGYSAYCDTVLRHLIDNDSIYGFPALSRVSSASAKASMYFSPETKKEKHIDISKKQEYYLNHSFEYRNFQDEKYDRDKNTVPNSLRYHGSIYILMGRETVSAAEYFAIMLSQNKKTVFLGEKTAGANSQPYYFVLPSGIKVMINTGKCYDFKNQDVSSGFPPDYELDLYDLFRSGSHDKVFKRLIDVIHNLKLKR